MLGNGAAGQLSQRVASSGRRSSNGELARALPDCGCKGGHRSHRATPQACRQARQTTCWLPPGLAAALAAATCRNRRPSLLPLPCVCSKATQPTMLTAVNPVPATPFQLAPAFAVGQGAVTVGRVEDNVISAIRLNTSAPLQLPDKLVNMVSRKPSGSKLVAGLGFTTSPAVAPLLLLPRPTCIDHALSSLPNTPGVTAPRPAGGGGRPAGADRPGGGQRHVRERRAHRGQQPQVALRRGLIGIEEGNWHPAGCSAQSI